MYRLLALLLTVICAPLSTSAHEVYVLDKPTIASAMAAQSPNPFSAYFGNEFSFYFWGLVTFIVFSTALAATLFRVLEAQLTPIFNALKKFALPVARVATGLCFLAFAYSGNIYGSELFLSEGFGAYAPLIQLLIAMMGLLVTIGLWSKLAGLGMTLLYMCAYAAYGPYILTYTDFLGAALLVAILGGGKYSVDGALGIGSPALLSFTKYLSPYAFAILRICFGWGVLYASVYAKFIHSQLALDVVTIYDLTRFFPFEPLFVVLGALIIEFLCGALVVFGVALRWTLLFLAGWLTLSLLYFQEMIWPHGILFGLAIALFLHGYDRYSLEGYVLKKRGIEPVL